MTSPTTLVSKRRHCHWDYFDVYWIGFVTGFGFYRRQISKRSTSGYRTFRVLVEYSFVLLNDHRWRSYANTINIKTSKKSCFTSLNCIALWMLYSIGDWQYFNVTYQRLCMNWTTVYATGFTFADVYFKDVSAPLQSICYLGPHVWYIKEKEIKQARQKKARQKGRKKKKKKRLGQIQTQYAKDLYSK